MAKGTATTDRERSVVVNGYHKDLRPWVRVALAQGWRVSFAGTGHALFLPPEGGRISVTNSSLAGRRLYNVRATLRRAGLRI